MKQKKRASIRNNSVRLGLISLTILLAASYLAAAPLPKTDDPNQAIVDLQPMLPDREQFMKWTPMGKVLSLTKTPAGLEAGLFLGPQGTPPVLLRLERGSGQSGYDTLQIDENRNGRFDDKIKVKANVGPFNNVVYHSFKAVLSVPAADPKTGRNTTNPYPVSIWYTENNSADSDIKLYFTRDGWMMGSAIIDNTIMMILLADDMMDGVFDRQDRWAITPPARIEDIYKLQSSRKISDTIRFGQYMYQIAEIHPSGRRLTLRRTDAGPPILFLNDFEQARKLAARQHKPLFVYFTTKGCGFCLKMEKDVFTDNAVINAAAEMVAVKIEADKIPHLASRFNVNGYPTFFLLSPEGTVLKQVAGYQDIAKMTAFLKTTPPSSPR